MFQKYTNIEFTDLRMCIITTKLTRSYSSGDTEYQGNNIYILNKILLTLLLPLLFSYFTALHFIYTSLSAKFHFSRHNCFFHLIQTVLKTFTVVVKGSWQIWFFSVLLVFSRISMIGIEI